MKKILLSLGIIAIVAVGVVGATRSFFSDTETSTGNTFTAGAIDLQIDNESYVTDPVTGVFGASSNTSWQLADSVNGLFDGKLFFNFTDLKPGDVGEDTISLHVNNNDAWACAKITLTEDDDVSSTEPELESPDVVENASDLFDGELASRLNFVWWADDGDNVLEADEASGVNAGKGVMGSLDWMMNETDQYFGDAPNEMLLTLADSHWNFFTGSDSGPIAGGAEKYIGKAWCLGTLTLDPVAQGEDSSPLVRGTGISCDGAPEGNITQTDSIKANVEFTAVQSRNNDNFLCAEHQTPTLPDATVTSGTGWSPVDTDSEGGSTGKEWLAKAKVQEPNPASDFELQVGINDTSLFNQGDTVWGDNTQEAFTLTYDGSGGATLAVVGRPTVTYTVGPGTFGRIGITLKAPSDATTSVNNLSLNVATLGTNNVSVSGGTQNLTISGVDLSSGFVLTGNFTFDWGVLTSNGENQKVQFSID